MILTSDIHLRITKPVARIDDYWRTQKRKFKFILKLAQKSPPLVVAGDFFDVPRPSPKLVSWTISMLRKYPVELIIAPGQHDLPYHLVKNLPDSGLAILEAAGLAHLSDYETTTTKIFVVPFGEEPELNPKLTKPINVLAWHHMVISKSDPLWAGQQSENAGRLLRTLKKYDIIITGDNHHFVKYKKGNRYLLNPGTMIRMDVTLWNHNPSVYMLGDTGNLRRIIIPHDTPDDVLSREHLNQKKKQDSKISAFILKALSPGKIKTSFKKNMEAYFRKHKVRRAVKSMIRAAMPERKND